MSPNPEQFSIPEDHDHSQAVKGQHAGNSDDPKLREVAVVDFSMPLAQAAKQGKLLDRDSLGPVDNDPAPITEEEQIKARETVLANHPKTPENNNKLIKRVSAGLAIAALTVGAWFVKTGIENTTTPDPEQTSSAGVVSGQNTGSGETTAPSPNVSPTNSTPLETASPTIETKQQLIASLELSAEKYPDVNSLAKAIIVDRYTAWINQGVSQEAYDKYMDPNLNKTVDDFAQEEVLENADVFPEAIYVKNYKDIPSLEKDKEATTGASGSVLARRLITWDDRTPYERHVTLSSEPKIVAGSIESGEVTFTVSLTDTSNASENRIGTEYDKDDTIPYVGTRTITTVIIDGKWKIADIQYQ